MRPRLTVTLLAAACAAAGILGFTMGHAATAEDRKIQPHAFELRIYTPAPGKMDALHARFRDHTTKLFVKHGMTNVAYWVAVDPKDNKEKLFYVLSHASKDAAAASWKAFRDDPDWKAAKAASEKDGSLTEKDGVLSIFMTPTDYSPMK